MYYFYFLNIWIFENVCWSFFDLWKHINMDVALPFWVIVRAGRQNVMNHIAMMGGPYLFFGGAGNPFTMSHTATRGSSWPYTDFKFLVTSFPGGGGYALIWNMGVSTLIWVPPPLYGSWGAYNVSHSTTNTIISTGFANLKSLENVFHILNVHICIWSYSVCSLNYIWGLSIIIINWCNRAKLLAKKIGFCPVFIY